MWVGKRPRKGRKEDLPTPTELMKQREFDLELDKNLNKTMVVQNPTGRGPGQAGFHCEACNRTYKDTTAYLDHINGRQRKQDQSLSCRRHLLMSIFRFTETWSDNTYCKVNSRAGARAHCSPSREDEGSFERQVVRLRQASCGSQSERGGHTSGKEGPKESGKGESPNRARKRCCFTARGR